MRTPPIPDKPTSTIIPHVEIGFPKAKFCDTGKRVVELDPIYLRAGAASYQTRITLENTTEHGARISDLWDTAHPCIDAPVRIFLEIDGVPFELFTGVIGQVVDLGPERVSFECTSIASAYDKPIGTVIDKDSYPNVPDGNIGKIIPWVWGSVDRFRPVLVDDDMITQLTASLIHSDTIIYVESTADFTDTGSIQINDEEIYYDYKTDISFGDVTHPVTRGYNGTAAGSHVVGNQVIEYGPLQFLVANHDVASIDEVYYIGDQDVLVAADPADYAVTLTKPARIDFTKAPTFDEPQPSHKLKLVDMDTDDSSSGALEPENAAGANASWEPTNYAEIPIDAGGTNDLRLKRVDDVPPPVGKPVRAWVVIENWKTTDSQYKVYYDGNYLGDLTDSDDTPDDLKDDGSIISMGAGFEDEHIHELPEGDHYHLVDGSGTYDFTPSIDSGADGDAEMGTHYEAYDGSWDTYGTFDIQGTGSPARTNISFHNCYVPEGINLSKTVDKFRLRVKIGRPSWTSPQGNFDLIWFIRDYTSTTPAWNSYYVMFNKNYAALPNITIGEDPLTVDTGWVSVATAFPSVDRIVSGDIINAYFILLPHSITPNGEFYLYNLTQNFQLQKPDNPEDNIAFTYEPVGQLYNASGVPISGSEEAYDLDWLTYYPDTSSVPWTLNCYADWTAISELNSRILGIMPIASVKDLSTPATNVYQLRINSAAHGALTLNFDAPTLSFYDMPSTSYDGTYVDLSSLTVYGYDLVTTGTYIKKQSTTINHAADVIELGAWVYYDGSTQSQTSIEDVGDTDQQQGNWSHNNWYDITSLLTDINDWQEYVGKQIKVEDNDTDDTMTCKVLRAYVAVEFIPVQKKIARDIVCDVTGRSGGFDDIITDIVEESDLLGMPSGSVSVPALTVSGAGVVLEHISGFELLNNIMTQARCHGWFDWASVFNIRYRPARGDVPGGDFYMNRGNLAAPPSVQSFSNTDLVNQAVVKYAFDFVTTDYGGSVTRDDASSQTKYGKTVNAEIQLDFIRDKTDAETVGDHMLSYKAEVLDQAHLRATKHALNLEPGDVGAYFWDEYFRADKIEVREVSISGILAGQIMVDIKGIRLDDR